MSILSFQRAAVLAFPHERIAQSSPPSLAEIATEFGFASRNAAQKHVHALAEAGLIELRPGQKHGIRIPGGEPEALLVLPALGGWPSACRSVSTLAWTGNCGWTDTCSRCARTTC